MNFLQPVDAVDAEVVPDPFRDEAIASLPGTVSGITNQSLLSYSSGDPERMVTVNRLANC